ncbi:surface lipoprotein assembly modifier [Puniceibacterium sediminis]|uniref:Surface lipoprotein assembly modifier C-terminal domain-containing protein n=1 Tax=Puniceibacterium sediminis TaxID=1608407 RepID=A0A238YTC5_9RHOB|nr:surface lipoprotein assembly modifier [Puniceibacterium sediminis]SNR73709.1 Protein of unknown function [Puniceibacterium sediminis]
MPWKPIAIFLSLATAATAQTSDFGSGGGGVGTWSTRLSFGMSRTSNINSGYARAPMDLQDLPFSFALESGEDSVAATRTGVGIATAGTLAEGGSARTLLNLSAYRETVILTDSHTELDSGDFTLTSLTAGVNQSWFRLGDRLTLGTEATLGQVFLGGDPLYANLNLGGSVRYAFSPGMTGHLRAMREAQKGYDDRADAHAWRGSAGVTTMLSQGHEVSASFNYAEGSSSEDYLDYADHEIALRLALAQPVLGASVELGLSADHNHHARNAFSGGKRDDDTVRAEVTMLFDSYDFNGLVPSVSLQGRKTDSNIDNYDSKEVGLELGLRSQF